MGLLKEFEFQSLMILDEVEYKYDEMSHTFNFVPFILMDRRIKKVAGDGKTIETAYTIAFNN